MNSPDGFTNVRAVLICCGSVTHAHNYDQRFIELVIETRTRTGLTVAIPNRPAILPPGFYLLFLVTPSGTPSIARFIQISHTAPLVKLPNQDGGEFDAYDFGTVRLHEQRVATFQFTNVGIGNLRVIEVTPDGDFRTKDVPFDPLSGRPEQRHNLEFEVLQSSASPRDQIEVKVTFIAEESGPHLGIIEIMTNTVNLLGGRIRIPVHAHVRALDLLLLQPALNTVLDLGAVNVNVYKTAPIVLRNVGTMDAMLDSYEFSASEVTPQVGVETGPINKGQVRTYNLTYVPTHVGLLNTNLTLHFTDGVAPSQYSRDVVIPLRATGIGAQVEISHPLLDFGMVAVGSESTPQSIFVRNAGQQPLVITGTSVSSECRVTGALPANIAPGQTEQLSVVFRPGHGGFLSFGFTISSNSAQPPTPISLQGIGVIQPLPQTTPSAVGYGATPVGSRSGEEVVVVHNDGGVPVQLGAISIVGANAPEFLIVGTTCAGVVLPPEGTCEVRIVFAPSSSGAKQATLEFAHNGPTSPLQTPLAGQALAALGLVPNASDLNFSRVTVGVSSGVLRLVMTNAAATPANIVGVAVNGTAAADFKIVSDSCSGSVLGSGTSCSIGLSVQPSVAGSRLASLTVNANVPANAVSLRADGIAMILKWFPAPLDFGENGRWRIYSEAGCLPSQYR